MLLRNKAKIKRLENKRKHEPVGTGARFRALESEGLSPDLAAWIGRKKYGKKKFQALEHHRRG